MELRHLRYFVALAERLNFTQAAEQMHVTQPTLSHQIKQLEAQLDSVLFERGDRRVRLSAAGEALLPSVIEALGVIDRGVASLKGARSEPAGHLRLATSQTFNIAIVPRAVGQFCRNHAAVKVTVEEFTLEEMTEGLRDGVIDMAIAHRPADIKGLQFEPLCNEELVLIARADHPLARLRRVRMIELHRRDLLMLPPRFMTRQLLQEAFDAAGTEPRVAIESGTIPSLLALVEQTGAPTILSRYAVPPNTRLKVVPLESPRPMRTTGLITSRKRVRPPLEAAFAMLMRRTTGEYLNA